jgi:C1A family cysteine protease
VKDQGPVCGSCWAFSATGAIESAYAISTGGSPPSLSEQQLIDCATYSYSNLGCGGGYYTGAFQYVIDHGGIASESDYPYVDQNSQYTESCRPPSSQVKVNSFYQVPPGSETQLEWAVNQQPVSVNIRSTFLQHYSGGIMSASECNNAATDGDWHSVLVTGYYNDLAGTNYWIVKSIHASEMFLTF